MSFKRIKEDMAPLPCPTPGMAVSVITNTNLSIFEHQQVNSFFHNHKLH